VNKRITTIFCYSYYQKLLQLRAQDRKSNARVQAMLSRTKAANKAVLDDVKKSTNTAVTSQGMPPPLQIILTFLYICYFIELLFVNFPGLDIQPDDDDYGYVSKVTCNHITCIFMIFC